MYPTTDHNVIRSWANLRKALPAVVRGPNDGVPAVMRFIIPGANYNNRNLDQISWEFFFAKFDLLGLSFAYTEWNDRGEMSSDNQLLKRERVDLEDDDLDTSDRRTWN